MARRKVNKSEGLGDTVHKVLESTGIDKLAKFVLGEDCGCEERRKKWNELFRYRNPNCLSEEQYNYLKEFFDRSPNKVEGHEVKELTKIYNHVYHWKKREVSSCSSCVASMLGELNKIYQDYE